MNTINIAMICLKLPEAIVSGVLMRSLILYKPPHATVCPWHWQHAPRWVSYRRHKLVPPSCHGMANSRAPPSVLGLQLSIPFCGAHTRGFTGFIHSATGSAKTSDMILKPYVQVYVRISGVSTDPQLLQLKWSGWYGSFLKISGCSSMMAWHFWQIYLPRPRAFSRLWHGRHKCLW